MEKMLRKPCKMGVFGQTVGAVAYTLEIYFDFSGYSDMAIGLGQCFGFHFKENFNRPYLADSVNDFWKRWHISLTDWFRDYVYIPLGGNRVSQGKVIRNIILVWVLTGIWHGANWTFFLWGCIYCIFQLAEKYLYDVKKWPYLLRRLYTLLIICICWVIFRADNVTAAFSYIADMFGRTTLIDADGIAFLKNSIVTIVVAIIACFPWGVWTQKIQMPERVQILVEMLGYIALIAIVLITASASIGGGYSPFIYFNF